MTEIGEPARPPSAAKAASAARRKVASKRDLLFAIRYYRAYASHAWKPFHSSKPDDHGEIGADALGCNGDRTATVPMLKGYVYVLKGKKLAKTFAVEGGMYQEVKISSPREPRTRTAGACTLTGQEVRAACGSRAMTRRPRATEAHRFLAQLRCVARPCV